MTKENKPRIIVDQIPSQENDEVVRNALHEFNVAQIGQDEHYSVFAFSPEGKIIGGLLVYQEAHSIFIDILWIDESERGKGLGTELLLAAEKEAVRRKVPYSTTDTLAFQAVNFYRKNGYEQIGMVKNYIEGHDRYFFRKKLDSTEP
jgi:GNAT superfamily N-acetyltransferase|tara:strand:- start:53863 stop:54303 length:441 start_codon:yes stop_codon:yes gene_type:complete